MEKHQKFSMWYVLLGIWVVLILQKRDFFGVLHPDDPLQRVFESSRREPGHRGRHHLEHHSGADESRR